MNEKINSLLTELATIPAISEENARKLEDKFRLEFSFNSNHIEGNTLTYGETKLLLIFDKIEGTGIHEMREFEEMKAHDVAYRWIKELAGDKSYRLIERDIKQLNEIILVRPFWKEALTPDGQPTRRQIEVGEYKQHPNSVRLQNGEMFHYTTPIDTPMAMHDLLNWFHDEAEKKELSPVELAAIFHYKFVLIHPFDDGNGRISRLLVNYVLLQNDLPPIIIKSADKKNYLNALNQADTGNLNAFVQYISQQLIWSLELTLKATKGQSIEEDDDIDKQVALFKREQLDSNDNRPLKTAALVQKVYQNIIQRILIKLEEKISVFDELFENTDFSYRIKDIRNDQLFFEKSHFENELIEKWSENNNKINSISWEKEFDSSVNKKIANTKLVLSFSFNKRFLEIHLSGTEARFQFSYNQNLSESEISAIANQIYKGIFEQIQANTRK